MIKFLTFLILSGLLLSCSKLEYNERYMDVENIRADSMNSSLGRVKIIADPDTIDYLLDGFKYKIVIKGLFEYYDSHGNFVFQDSCKFEVRGTGSAFRPMKSIGVELAQSFNNNAVQMLKTDKVRPQHNLNELQFFRLRNSGQDFGRTMMRDLAYSELMLEYPLDLELKYGNPIHLFFNDSYYGLLNIRSDFDPAALATTLGVDSSDIGIIKMDKENGSLEHDKGESALALELEAAIENESLTGIYKTINIPNFIDYILFQDYIGNTDWPGSNVEAYSVNRSKFKFLLYDLDFAAFKTNSQILPKMEYLNDDLSKIYQILFFQDSSFKTQLEERQVELYKLFETDDFERIVQERVAAIENEIPYLMSLYKEPLNTMQWHLNIDQLIRDQKNRDRDNRKKYKLAE